MPTSDFSQSDYFWFKFLIQIQILNDKQCRSRSVGQLIWIYTVCKGRAYPSSAGQGLILINGSYPLRLTVFNLISALCSQVFSQLEKLVVKSPNTKDQQRTSWGAYLMIRTQYFSDFLYKIICCWYSFELPRLVEAIQMSTNNMFYTEIDKSTLAVI